MEASLPKSVLGARIYDEELIADALPDSECPSLDDPNQLRTASGDYDTDYFGGCHDYDSIDEEFEEPLSWKMDPSRSLSDWTIEISHESSGSTTGYCVHKNMLAVGPKTSAYFSSLFRCTQQVSESATSTSRITLEDSAADSFPEFLDFMYSPSHHLRVNTRNAVALRYLAQYFGIRMLHRKVMDFLRKDINLGNVDSYIADSFRFHDEKISSFVADTCSTHILELCPDSGLIKTVNPTFFLHVISSPEIDTCAVSGHLSKLVASYCNFHKHEIDELTFRKLTHRNHMPLIERDASLSLLEIESELCQTELHLDTSSHESASEILSCLQKRCIRVLALNWKELLTDNQKDEAYSVLKKLKSHVVMELFDKSLCIAEQRLEEAAKTAEVERLNLEHKYDTKLNEANERCRHQKKLLERVRQDTTETINQLRLQLAERDRQLSEYRREVNCFHRVPTSYSFSDIKKSTYHHLSQAEPFDSSAYPCQFGRRRPTTLPRLGDRSEDGYLFVSQEKGGTQTRLPMYYYQEPPSGEYMVNRKNHNVLRRVQQNSCNST